jgi:hypothetical protein
LGNRSLIILGLVIVLAITWTLADVTDRLESHKLRQTLPHLVSIPEFEWLALDGGFVYIGFNSIPNNLDSICDEAVAKGSIALEKNLRLWAIDANKYDKNWDQSKGEYLYKTYRKYDDTQTPDSKK